MAGMKERVLANEILVFDIRTNNSAYQNTIYYFCSISLSSSYQLMPSMPRGKIK